MSDIFSNEVEQRQFYADLTRDWDGQNDLEPGALEGVITGTGQGLMRGGAQAARSIGIAGSVIPAALDALVGDDNYTDESLTDRYFSAVDEAAKNAVDYWTPNAYEVGTVGQVLGSVAGIALPLMAGGGNPSLLIATETLAPAAEMVDKGVDASTAVKAGIVQGASTGLGAWLPFFGGTLGKRVAIGAGANAALGAGSRGLEGAILEAGGYSKLAKQYDAFDAQALAVDALMGGAFGALPGHAPSARTAVLGERGGLVRDAFDDLTTPLKPSDIDAIFSAANIKNWQVDSAPGRPLDPQSWRQHGDAIELAARQLAEGQPVDVVNLVDGAAFTAKPGGLSSMVRALLDRQESSDFMAEASRFLGKDSIKLNAGNLAATDVAAIERELTPIAEGRLRRAEAKSLQRELRDLEARQARIEAQSDYKEAAKQELKGTRQPARTAVKLAEEIRARDLQPVLDAITSTRQRLDAHDVAAQANAMLSRLETYRRQGKFAGDKTDSFDPDAEMSERPFMDEPWTPAESLSPNEANGLYARDVFAPENQPAPKREADALAIDTARQLLDELGDFDIRIAALADDGEAGQTKSVKALMEEADVQIAESKSLGQGILAAAKCFIGLGVE